MFPTRLSMVTYNLWNDTRWSQREPALKRFLELFQPDILCLQELRAVTQAFLDETLPQHRRVHDELAGWTCEGNIYWHGDLLELVEYGAEDIGILEEHRRLFWARLKLKGQDRTIFVGTAHFTYQGHPHERETGESPRVRQSQHTVEVLQKLVKENEPAFFMGDLNDPLHPSLILYDAGYVSCFAALGIPCPSTFPCLPTKNVSPGMIVMNQTIDWVVANQHARPLAAQVPHCYYDDVAPSDHWPVLAIYEV